MKTTQVRAVATMLVCLVLAVGLTASRAYGWGAATHAYIDHQLQSRWGYVNLSEIYGGMAPDVFNYLFDSPYQAVLYEQSHYNAMQVWNAAQSRGMVARGLAYGFVSHNDLWGADYTAHHAGRYFGLGEGYVVAKAEQLLTLAPFPAFLGLPEPVGLELAHILVETGVDILMTRLDPQIGDRMMASAVWRSPVFPTLLVDSFAAGLPLSPQEAAALIAAAETEFRTAMLKYGLALRQSEAVAVVLLSSQLAGLAEDYLAAYGLSLPVSDAATTAIIALYTYLAMGICSPDYAQEIALTIDYVDEQLRLHGVTYVHTPLPPSVILLASGLLGIGWRGARRLRKS